MKDLWRERYRKLSEEEPELDFSILSAFNANIDVRTDLEKLEWDLSKVDSKYLESVGNISEVKSVLKFAIENGNNLECKIEGFKPEINGERSIGGQAGIMANFLAGLEGSVTFYTPFLSEELSMLVDDRVLHPYIDEEFVLKNVRDAGNADRTKENVIIEYNEEKSGRLILSDKLRGFGPYFRSGIEENLDLVDKNIDRILLSGFHNAQGNFESKIKKAVSQLDKLDSPKHLEMVDCEEKKFKYIMEGLTPHVQSIGLDETEAKKVMDFFNKEPGEELHIGEAFEMSKLLLERSGLERVHLHTYRYHLIVTEEDYPVSLEGLRDSMVFGEVSALLSAQNGDFPSVEDYSGLDFEKIHLKKLDELEEFQDFFNLDSFVENGYSMVEGYKVAAIPALIHEDPVRLVGMGDLISAGAYVYEMNT